MANRNWISYWFMLTAPLMLWDAAFCFMRPRSMVGGDLHWLWKIYDVYGQVDRVYGVQAFEDGEGLANAAAILNVLENVAAISYLYLVHVSPSPLSSLAGYTGATMTFAKTCLYVAKEYYCGLCTIGHNDFGGMMFYWIMPNCVWLTFSILIMYTLGLDIARSLTKGPLYANHHKLE
ncbi:hypothetical protein E1B28_011643 [Marasmius oreades]|uniref:EXPERA domain-containing protein n=1 Tax=Marasmius oreades TaxID=181124 RepID=A0A9P7RV61_9AGAR|nr:uncharacterized protein E1B28_011643 [Marasmius oreades]KAG7090022.1 hypothetical protein E1B28_011643 [Marasmius oreades]